ncbi:hypothetical protein BCR41DRAFT_419624 [Lobosporangium transversale]|uniref:RRM domain-containing protein n=1 Tax=Lobosporangium transversale TaxID=64571 RepID=A0A1Y2GWJ4_9FUNG|nr:hypothetical protein BCR41DRAFT_419624 [Lobosporangium transversale]ORZ26635.1 hypothetical protein BCR41DRAFT_419624 [Lobosporangium transversale]|eukprot:XP_021884398.1 hypothetical protein BCR41DRAFT_419624 [Lobosporangium transversale]
MGEKLTKKQKKTNEFRGKKRKLDESVADLPEEDVVQGDNADSSSNKEDTKNKKKDKSSKDESKGPSPSSTGDDSTEGMKKKRRRGKGSSKEDPAPEAGTQEGDAVTTSVKAAPKNAKFIVFVGNLPYNITKEQLEKHFESCGKGFAVRIQTDKVTKKGKGFAFLEFPDSESMQKALFFNKTLIKERPINVELTAGGGGNKSANRKKKIAEKNEALNEERRKVHEKHIAPAKEAKSSYAAANPAPAQKAAAPKPLKKPTDMSDANSISVEGLAARLRRT